MGMSFESTGDLRNTLNFLEKIKMNHHMHNLDKYGRMGVDALSKATPVDSGLTANSWAYEIVESSNGITIEWHNTNIVKGYFNVALMLQYGHATKSGTFIRGIDYINPAIQPVFEKIAMDAWTEVTQ